MSKQVVAIIPIRGADAEFHNGNIPMLAGRPLIEYTLTAAKEAQRLNRVIVSTESEAIAGYCREQGVEAPLLRPEALNAPTATVTDVLRHTLGWLKDQENYSPEWVVKLEITHPFRSKGMIDLVVETALSQKLDSAFLVYEEISSFWTMDKMGKPQQVGEEVDVPRGVRRPFYRDLSGLVAITRATNLAAGNIYGEEIGLIPWRDIFATVDTHEGSGEDYRQRVGFRLAELLAEEFNASLAETAGEEQPGA